MQESRLFKIVYYLLGKGKVTAPQLAEEFEVSVRTIYRDIDALSSAGIPIYCTQGKGGGISLLDGYVFDKSLISHNEQQMIMAALQGLSAVTQQGEHDLLLKLQALFKQNNPDWIQVDFSRWSYNNQDNEKFSIIKGAIFSRQIIAFQYTSCYGTSGNRKVKPLKICYKSNGWYLQAYCMERKGFRTFKINRIQNLETVPEYFESGLVPPPLEIGDSGNKYPLIKIRFRKEIAYRVYDEFDKAVIKEEENGDITVNIRLPDDEWLYGYLLSFCGYVEILEPHDIKMAFMKILKDMFHYYIKE